jgi:hypothetical protein
MGRWEEVGDSVSTESIRGSNDYVKDVGVYSFQNLLRNSPQKNILRFRKYA